MSLTPALQREQWEREELTNSAFLVLNECVMAELEARDIEAQERADRDNEKGPARGNAWPMTQGDHESP